MKVYCSIIEQSMFKRYYYEKIKNLEDRYPEKIIVLQNEKNSGIGFSVKKGMKKALELDNDIIIKFDGDNQHLPDDIPKFKTKLIF